LWIADLSGYEDSGRTLAVGWLERGHEYPAGEVSAEVYTRLEGLLVDPWQPAVAAGLHPCDICGYRPEKQGTMDLFVPGD
jgi:hypothetical protein